MSEQDALTNDERHWRTAGILTASVQAQWVAMDEALRPFVACDDNDHHPSCCPAVIAAMKAAGLYREGVIYGTPEDLFGPMDPDLLAQHEATIRQIEEARRMRPEDFVNIIAADPAPATGEEKS